MIWSSQMLIINSWSVLWRETQSRDFEEWEVSDDESWTHNSIYMKHQLLICLLLSLSRWRLADRWSNRMINVENLCDIITINIKRYVYVDFEFVFLIYLCLIVASAAIFQVEYMKFDEWFVALWQSLCIRRRLILRNDIIVWKHHHQFVQRIASSSKLSSFQIRSDRSCNTIICSRRRLCSFK